ncbi:MAG: hypothetical protein H6739_09980 [Alphaproteobacteria bacterium]|nr:hypothetical protein [Alphaproteobacteria bacterium]
MSRIDQFESLFKAAAHPVYSPGEVSIRKVMVITDHDADATGAYAARLRAGFLQTLAEASEWIEVPAGQMANLGELLALTERVQPDLAITWRNLHSSAWRWPYSLGAVLEVLTQHAGFPVLLMPRPEEQPLDALPAATDEVMALTDHLVDDHRIVDWGLRFTRPGGELILTHIEDSAAFERIIAVIGRIPEIDTDTARELIGRRLLEEPREYVASVAQAVTGAASTVRVREVVRMGHHLAEITGVVQERGVDLLVLNTKDDDQSAMHGLAYPLAVELRTLPMLML